LETHQTRGILPSWTIAKSATAGAPDDLVAQGDRGARASLGAPGAPVARPEPAEAG
jgi:hypothetical protein